MKKDKRIFGKVIMVLAVLFFYVPILFMIIFSFNSGRSLTNFDGFSLMWYERMFENRDMMESLQTTIVIALIATLVSTLLGTISAIGLSRCRKVLRKAVLQLNDLPIMNPEIVTAIGLMLLFITFHIERGFVTMLLAHIAFCTPYVILSVMPKIRSLDPNLADAAMDLGATPWQALTKVLVPQIMPGIVSGALIAFTMSFDDFIISYFVTGGGVEESEHHGVYHEQAGQPEHQCNFHACRGPDHARARDHQCRSCHQGEKGRENMKKLLASCAAMAMALTLTGCGSSGSGDREFEGQELHLYNWGEYMGENLIADFEEQTGAKVVVDYFDSNEQMYIKVANGEAYDVLVPSDYMIERLIQEDLLQPLDKSKLSNLDLLNEDVMGLEYDPENEYSIPYFWGTVGIVYDKNKVSEEDLQAEGYNIFLDTKYKGDIYLYDSERDSFMMALKALGYSMNTSDENELNEAYEWLVQCVETMEPEIVTDEIIDNMAQGRKALGLIYSGDATYVMSENEDMGFYMPESGTNLWSDAMVIPKNAENPELAHAFIDYVCTYEASMGNSSYVGYTSPNQEVMDELSGAGGDFEGINAYIPRADNENDEVFKYDEATRKVIADLFSRVKVAASNA